MSKITYIGGDYIQKTGGSNKIYVKGNYEIHSGKQIIQTAEKGISFGKPESPPPNPYIEKVEFLDEKNKVLKQESLAAFGGIIATNFLIGKNVKIKITTKDVVDGTKISFELKAETKCAIQDFFGIGKFKWILDVEGNTCTTDFFEFDNMWFNENYENYNYTSHTNEIVSDDLNSFYVKGVLNARSFEFPALDERLKPVTYLRNYEELIGLFHTNNSNTKDMVENYENKFIKGSPFENIVYDFSQFINHTKDLTIAQIKIRVVQDAKLLWETAVKQVQGGNLDDRPLYWARLKMQVRLKQHYLFENDINFIESTVIAGSELEKIITLFEEKSRNYTGINFNSPKAVGCKKVLITGFDPFVINPFHPNDEGKNDRQNPSGISVLNFHGKTIGNAYIQCAMIPVRYEDFDNGIIENIVKNNINQPVVHLE